MLAVQRLERSSIAVPAARHQLRVTHIRLLRRDGCVDALPDWCHAVTYGEWRRKDSPETGADLPPRTPRRRPVDARRPPRSRTLNRMRAPARTDFDAHPVQLSYARARHGHALGDQQGALERFVAAVAAQPPRGRYHTMARHVRTAAAAHDIAHRTRRARTPRQCGHVAVGRDATHRDAPDRAENAVREARTAEGAHKNVSGSMP